jgi:hypothetical protein
MGMDAGISPAGTMKAYLLCSHGAEALLDFTLDGLSVFLFLPATILSSIITDGELDGP